MPDDTGKRGQHDQQTCNDERQVVTGEGWFVAEQETLRAEQVDQAEHQQQRAETVKYQES